MKRIFFVLVFTLFTYLFLLGIGYLASLFFKDTLSNVFSNAMLLGFGFFIGCFAKSFYSEN